MADKVICATHPTIPRYICSTIKVADKAEEQPQQKAAVEAPPAKDACELNEECRLLSIRLRALNSAKMGYPGL